VTDAGHAGLPTPVGFSFEGTIDRLDARHLTDAQRPVVVEVRLRHVSRGHCDLVEEDRAETEADAAFIAISRCPDSVRAAVDGAPDPLHLREAVLAARDFRDLCDVGAERLLHGDATSTPDPGLRTLPLGELRDGAQDACFARFTLQQRQAASDRILASAASTRR